MINKLHVSINHDDKTITIKRGWFGKEIVFSGGYYTACTIDEVIKEFEEIESR